MKFISVRDLRSTPAQVWKQLPEEREMVITSNGKPIALLTPVDENSLEDGISAVRRARAIRAVERMQQQAMEGGLDGLSMDDIDGEIRDVRKNTAS